MKTSYSYAFGSVALVASLLVSACGGGGGGSSMSTETPNTGATATSAGISGIFSGIRASKEKRRETLGNSEKIGSVTKSSNFGDQVGVKKDAAGNIVFRNGAGVFVSVREPVVENKNPNNRWEGTNFAPPSGVQLFHVPVICGETCSEQLNTLVGENAFRKFYFAFGFWHQGDDFGTFVDGSSPRTLPTNRVARFRGLTSSSGYYWREGDGDTPVGTFLGGVDFTARFDDTPTVSGELVLIGGAEGTASNRDFNFEEADDASSFVRFSLGEISIRSINNIYAGSGGSVSCVNNCRLASASENSWGGMFFDAFTNPSPVPDGFIGTYGISDVIINNNDYDFLGVFAAFSEEGEIISNPNPGPSPVPSLPESVVVQFGQADSVGAAAVAGLDIGLSHNAQNRLDFSIDNGPEDSLLQDIDAARTTRFPYNSYVSFGQILYYGERERSEESGQNRQFSYYGIYTDRESNSDSEYWVGGLWYEFPSGDSVTLSVYELGAFAYYEGLPLSNLPSSGTATFNGQAEGVALDTTLSSRRYYNYAGWKVRLNANFGSATTIDGELFNIIGTAADRPLPANIILGMASVNGEGFFSGQTSATGYAAGNWGGQLYGNGASHAAGTFSIDKSDDSQALVGWFQAGANDAELSISDDEKFVVQFNTANNIGTPSLEYVDHRTDYRTALRSDYRYDEQADRLIDMSTGVTVAIAEEANAEFSRDGNGLLDSNGNRLLLSDGRILLTDATGEPVAGRPVHSVSTGPAGSSLQNIAAESEFLELLSFHGQQILGDGRQDMLSAGGVREVIFYTDRTEQNRSDLTTDYLLGGVWLVSNNGALAEIGAFADYPGLSLINLPNSGTATYSGSASSVASDGAGNDMDDGFGHYGDWRVTLNANFAAGSASVSGALSDFESLGVSPRLTPPSDIILGAATITNEGFFSGATSATEYENGNWGGRFHGDGASHAAGTFGLRKTGDTPQSVFGFFHAEKQ